MNGPDWLVSMPSIVSWAWPSGSLGWMIAHRAQDVDGDDLARRGIGELSIEDVIGVEIAGVRVGRGLSRRPVLRRVSERSVCDSSAKAIPDADINTNVVAKISARMANK